VKNLFDSNLHITLMTLPCVGILIFNIVPLVYMITMAFTTYSKEGEHLVLFDWDGLHQFQRVLNMNGNIGRQFWHVLAWTVVWAIFATFLNYILGMMLAMVINRKDTKWKGFWRFCFVLSIAVPQFVSLMIMNIMLQPSGAVNVLLRNLGLISEPIPFWTNAMVARITIIVINLWVGIPYTMIQVTGILQNIPEDLYEAAKMDGAGPATIFFKITLPYMLFVTMPYLIASFVGNINNFNVIYLLSGGGPTYVGDTAGQTDLLVTWLYKLTIDQQYYNLGAVIGIMTFVILTVITLTTYRNSSSYKNEEAFM
jgi:arabinogalactan oligomer/maltooligosaccharide transport system permease protein